MATLPHDSTQLDMTLPHHNGSQRLNVWEICAASAVGVPGATIERRLPPSSEPEVHCDGKACSIRGLRRICVRLVEDDLAPPPSARHPLLACAPCLSPSRPQHTSTSEARARPQHHPSCTLTRPPRRQMTASTHKTSCYRREARMTKAGPRNPCPCMRATRGPRSRPDSR